MSVAVFSIKSTIDEIFRASGFDPDALTLSTSQKTWACSRVNTELPKAWESEQWPDLMLVESRTVAAGPLIAFVTAGQTTIGAIDADGGVFLADPRINRDAQRVKGCQVAEGNLYFADAEVAAGDTVWLRFRQKCPRYTLTVWASGTTYAAGDLVYVAATGHTYRALQAGTNKAPATETAYWAVVGVPEMFQNWLALRISAMRMTEEDGAGKQFNLANEELDRLRGVQVDQQNRGSRRARARMW